MSDFPSNSDLVVASAVGTFRGQKKLAERAIGQLGHAQLHEALHPETNSIAVIMKHMAGNMRSRWTEFLTTDGEKPWRHRDNEFVDDIASREELRQIWERGWECVFAAMDKLSDDDLGKEVKIRGEAHTVIRAIQRQIDHNAYHTGQIVLIARILAGDEWTNLSVPRGESEEYNRRVWQKT